MSAPACVAPSPSVAAAGGLFMAVDREASRGFAGHACQRGRPRLVLVLVLVLGLGLELVLVADAGSVWFGLLAAG